MFSQTLAVLRLSLHVYGVVSPSSWHLLVFPLKYVVYRSLCLTNCTGGNNVYTCTCMVMYVHVMSSQGIDVSTVTVSDVIRLSDTFLLKFYCVNEVAVT